MIISFYSYKGGVGRTQLAANLAAYLCYYKQRKVLIIDWDMEAPGVDFFFKVDRSTIKHGLLNLFNDFVKLVRNNANIKDNDLPKIFTENKSKYIINLIKSANKKGKVDFMPAGNYNDNFVKNVTSFDWYEFYETLNGKYFIEYLKEELNNSEYDYIFIDSRTGTSDYAGICNIQFPELNVFVIAPTNQNFKGCREIANSIINSPYVKNGLRKPLIMPILSRLDRTDNISGEWFGKFRETFIDIITNFLSFLDIDKRNFFEKDIKNSNFEKLALTLKNSYINSYIENTLLEYKTEISYGEKLLFFDDLRTIEYTTLEKQIVEIAKYIEFLINKSDRKEEIKKRVEDLEKEFKELELVALMSTDIYEQKTAAIEMKRITELMNLLTDELMSLNKNENTKNKKVVR